MSPPTSGKAPDDIDELVPDPQVQREFGVSAMTLNRWDHDPRLNFPPKIKIRERNFRSRRLLEAFKHELIVQAVHERSRARQPATPNPTVTPRPPRQRSRRS
jgi:hypothetical protein